LGIIYLDNKKEDQVKLDSLLFKINIMSTTNFPIPTQENRPHVSVKINKYKNAIIGVLATCIIALGAYTVYDKNKADKSIQLQQNQIAKVLDEKSTLQSSFDESLARLDSIATVNTGLYSQLTEKNIDIKKVKAEIRSILSKKNATAAELANAKSLINQLNEKITGLETAVASLTEENKILSNDKVVLTKEKEQLLKDITTTTEAKQHLEKKVEVASTLNASNISITPINIRKNGKEKVSSTAKKVDKLVVSFDVTNRIAEAGATDVYVLIFGPDGNPITTGSEIFATREDGNKNFTAKLLVEIETAKKQNVVFAFTPSIKFQQGSYKIMIYQNGFLIGEGIRELKKGGLFS